jgi:hypothetical protein
MPAKWQHRFERKSGRWVFVPSPEARATGIEIKMLAESRWRAPRHFFHLHSGRNVAALRCHGELSDALSNLKEKAQRSRLTFSDEKEQGPAEAVSAFNIELASGAPRAPLPEKLEEFREAFRISAGDLRRAGIQGYIYSVSPVQAKRYLDPQVTRHRSRRSSAHSKCSTHSKPVPAR